jgi:hypothetical protein
MSKRSQPTSVSLDHLVQSLQDLKRKAETMPPGGDLELLIEEHLTDFDRQCYEMCLKARGQSASSQPEAFPPSGVS